MYYVIEISHGDSKIEGKAVYEYSTLDEAVATYHQKLGTAMKSDLYTDELVIVIDADGFEQKREKWVKATTAEA